MKPSTFFCFSSALFIRIINASMNLTICNQSIIYIEQLVYFEFYRISLTKIDMSLLSRTLLHKICSRFLSGTAV